MESNQPTKSIGDEMIIPLDREGDAEIGIQCYQQQDRFFWRVEMRVDGEVLQAKMFLNSSEARAFARELQELQTLTLEVNNLLVP